MPGDRVSSWWSADDRNEIDIVGTAARRPTFVCSVKWLEDRSAKAYGGRFDPSIGPKLHVVSADDLYR